LTSIHVYGKYCQKKAKTGFFHVRQSMSLAYLNAFRDVLTCFLTEEAFQFVTAKNGSVS
jgi:hypothetical protein